MNDIDKALENAELAETEYLLFSRNNNFYSMWKLELTTFDEFVALEKYFDLLREWECSSDSLMICERSPIDPLCRIKRR